MKVSFAIAAAFALAAPVTVSAVECAEKQLDALGNIDTAGVEKACPSLFIEGTDSIDATKLETFTDETLKTLMPCKEKTCLAALQKIGDSTPDCSIKGLNIKQTYGATIKLCEAFAAGPVTAEKAKAMFKDISMNISNALESASADGSNEEDGSVVGTIPSVTTDKPATSGNSTKDAAKSTTVPAATTKAPSSGASVTTSGAFAMLATTMVAVSFLL